MVSPVPWTPDLQNLENRLNDRIEETSKRFRHRQIAIYVVMVALLCVVVSWLTWADNRRTEDINAFRASVIANCQVNQQNTRNMNALIDTIMARVADNKDLTPAEKAQAKALYEGAKGEVPECPPR